MGDEIFFNKKDKSSTGKFKNTFTKTKIGLVSSTATARVVSATAVGQDLFEQNKLSTAQVFVTRNINKIKSYIYSYPVDCYIGAATYSETILSLFFKRNNNLIDEIRLNVSKGEHMGVLQDILTYFNNPKNRTSFVIGEGQISDDRQNFLGVNKVITSVAKNVN